MLNCPEWIKWCREEEMSENEIRKVELLGIKTNKDFQKYACNFKLWQKAS